MQKTDKTTVTKHVLTTVALAALWLAGAAGGFAADAPAAPAKPVATPAASPDGSVARNDATPWRLIEVPGAWGKRSKKNLGGDAHTVWYRAFVQAPGELNVSLNGKPVAVKRPAEGIVVFETSAGAVYELR